MKEERTLFCTYRCPMPEPKAPNLKERGKIVIFVIKKEMFADKSAPIR